MWDMEGPPSTTASSPMSNLATAFDKAQTIAQQADRLGYDTFWMAEHHFQPEGYECLPNILLLDVHLAHLTERIKLGCAFNITPMWHPLRLAEDFATADILTGGRVVFKAFNQQSFSHHGKYYDIPPRVPYRGGTPRALDFMAKHGIKGTIGGGVAVGGAMDSVVVGYRDALVRAGREDVELGEDLSIGFHFYLADTQEKAIREAARYFEEHLKMFGPLRLTRGLNEQQIRDISEPKLAPYAGLPTLEGAVKAGAFLCGPPEQIIESFKKVEDRYPGLERVNVSHPVGTPQKVILEQLEWFAQEVMPAFKGRVGPSVPAD